MSGKGEPDASNDRMQVEKEPPASSWFPMELAFEHNPDSTELPAGTSPLPPLRPESIHPLIASERETIRFSPDRSGQRRGIGEFKFFFDDEVVPDSPIEVCAHRNMKDKKSFSLRFQPPQGETLSGDWGILNSADRFVHHSDLYVALPAGFNLCKNKNCAAQGTKWEKRGGGRRPRHCSVKDAIFESGWKHLFCQLPDDGIIKLHHFQPSGSGPSKFTAELFTFTTRPDTSLVAEPFFVYKNTVAVLRLNVASNKRKPEVREVTTTEKKKGQLSYVKIRPQVGLAGTETPGFTLIVSDAVPASRVQVIFKDKKNREAQPATIVDATTSIITIETPLCKEGEYKTFIEDGGHKIYGDPDDTDFKFTVSLHASAEPSLPRFDPDIEPFTVEKAFQPYHPELDGPLTMRLLKQISERDCYKRMGFTPLIVAAFVGDEALVRRLLSKKGPDQCDINGHSAIWWAERGWAPDVLPRVMRYEARQTKFKGKADPMPGKFKIPIRVQVLVLAIIIASIIVLGGLYLARLDYFKTSASNPHGEEHLESVQHEQYHKLFEAIGEEVEDRLWYILETFEEELIQPVKKRSAQEAKKLQAIVKYLQDDFEAVSKGGLRQPPPLFLAEEEEVEWDEEDDDADDDLIGMLLVEEITIEDQM